MSEFKIVPYESKYFHKWNQFVEDSNNGTIFHRLDFLEYHGEKFKQNEHHLIVFKGEHIFAILPLAIFEVNGVRVAKSPYGGSYGGVVTKDVLSYSNSKELVSLFSTYFQSQKINEVVFTIPLSILNKVNSDTFTFAFLEHGFQIINSDISSVIDLSQIQNLEIDLLTSRARNMMRKAIKAKVVPRLRQNISDFWQVLETTYQKHGTNPTHSFNEWKYLCEKFPDKLWCDVAYIGNKPIAGIAHVLLNNYTDSSFYLCNNPEYNDTQSLTLLIFESLKNSQTMGFRFFDFGTSSVNMLGRENIFRFKESFGSFGIFRITIRKKYD